MHQTPDLLSKVTESPSGFGLDHSDYTPKAIKLQAMATQPEAGCAGQIFAVTRPEAGLPFYPFPPQDEL
jgi:hypothetical protein